MALKIFYFSDIVHTSYYINKALKEYAFMKICSSLGCAPYLNNLLGFDLIVYDDSVMFSMEKCSEITKMKLATVKNLKYNLKLMHHHQIIHFDIKPENIMFSPHFMKPVFIDFGFT
jgi:serine/threonine protein kinase